MRRARAVALHWLAGMRVTLSNRTLTRTLAAALACVLGPVVAQAPHWAYRKPARPAVPRADEPAWADNAIDGFVLARMRAAGLAPSARADAPRLLRRLYLDLIGLPPSVEAVERFEQADNALLHRVAGIK